MNQNTKRLVLLNLPYVLMGLYATNLGLAWRLAVGADFSEKMMSLMSVLPDALGRIVPSFHPLDLIVGLCCGAGLRLAVYLKGKNAKKYRHGSEYGSARWGNAKDIEPYVAPKFEDNHHPDPDRTSHYVQPTQRPQNSPEQKCPHCRRFRQRQDALLDYPQPAPDAQFLCVDRS